MGFRALRASARTLSSGSAAFVVRAAVPTVGAEQARVDHRAQVRGGYLVGDHLPPAAQQRTVARVANVQSNRRVKQRCGHSFRQALGLAELLDLDPDLAGPKDPA